MTHYLYSLIALDIARERSRQAERSQLASSFVRTGPSRTNRLRHLAAQLLAGFSRGSATIVRRLDSCVADDLGRTLAPAE